MARHDWREEDGVAFAVSEDDNGAIVLEGERFSQTYADGDGAALGREVLHLRSEILGLVNPEPCVWTQPDEEGEVWESSCPGPAFYFEEGGPKANGFAFCPYCGHLLTEEPWEEPPLCGCGHREDRHGTSVFDGNPYCFEDCPCLGYDPGPPDDNLTDVEADAQTLEGVYGPEE